MRKFPVLLLVLLLVGCKPKQKVAIDEEPVYYEPAAVSPPTITKSQPSEPKRTEATPEPKPTVPVTVAPAITSPVAKASEEIAGPPAPTSNNGEAQQSGSAWGGWSMFLRPPTTPLPPIQAIPIADPGYLPADRRGEHYDRERYERERLERERREREKPHERLERERREHLERERLEKERRENPQRLPEHHPDHMGPPRPAPHPDHAKPAPPPAHHPEKK